MRTVVINDTQLEKLSFDEIRLYLKQYLRLHYFGQDFVVDDTGWQARVNKTTIGKLAGKSDRDQPIRSYRLRSELALHLDELLANTTDVRRAANAKIEIRPNVRSVIKGEVNVKVGKKYYRPTIVIRQDSRNNLTVHEISDVGGECGR